MCRPSSVVIEYLEYLDHLEYLEAFFYKQHFSHNQPVADTLRCYVSELKRVDELEDADAGLYVCFSTHTHTLLASA